MRNLKRLFTILLILSTTTALANVYPWPAAGDDLIGQMETVYPNRGEYIYDMMNRYNLGYYQMIEANPGIPRHAKLSPETPLIIPGEYILPNVPRVGIVINLSELRLYYFPADHSQVFTAPIAIGKVDWETPIMVTKVIEKTKDPQWVVPESLRELSAAKGLPLPKIVPAGPNNPLGAYALRLGVWVYLIHGTNNPQSIGKRASSGCIRMFAQNIEDLYNSVPVGTPVRVIDEHFKLGFKNHILYLEVHEPLSENAQSLREQKQEIASEIAMMTDVKALHIHWDRVDQAIELQNGLAVPIADGDATEHDSNLDQPILASFRTVKAGP